MWRRKVGGREQALREERDRLAEQLGTLKAEMAKLNMEAAGWARKFWAERDEKVTARYQATSLAAENAELVSENRDLSQGIDAARDDARQARVELAEHMTRCGVIVP